MHDGTSLRISFTAGFVQCFVIVPSDRIKCQLQVQTQTRTLTAGALRDCLRTLVREDGVVVGLMRGWWPTVWRQTLSAPVYFGSFEVWDLGRGHCPGPVIGRGHGGDVSSVLVRDPPPLPALRANLVAKGQQLLAIHIVAPKAPEKFFSFPLPILSTLHPNIILEPNLDSKGAPQA